MVDEPKAKLIARDKAMRHARDQMLRIVSQHLIEIGFTAARSDHFTRETQNQIHHIGFQKHTSGRDVRVMAHITLKEFPGTSITGPWNDLYSALIHRMESDTIFTGLPEKWTLNIVRPSTVGSSTTY